MVGMVGQGVLLRQQHVCEGGGGEQKTKKGRWLAVDWDEKVQWAHLVGSDLKLDFGFGFGLGPEPEPGTGLAREFDDGVECKRQRETRDPRPRSTDAATVKLNWRRWRLLWLRWLRWRLPRARARARLLPRCATGCRTLRVVGSKQRGARRGRLCAAAPGAGEAGCGESGVRCLAAGPARVGNECANLTDGIDGSSTSTREDEGSIALVVASEQVRVPLVLLDLPSAPPRVATASQNARR